jgi:anti-anti-sigma factor
VYLADTDDGEDLRLVLHRDIDLAVHALLHDTMDKVTALPPSNLTVDLTNVTFLSSEGLGFLAGLNTYLNATGHTTTLHAPAPIVLRALQICGFDHAFRITGI